MSRYKITYTAKFTVEIDVDEGETVDDVAQDIDVPEGPGGTYVADSFAVEDSTEVTDEEHNDPDPGEMDGDHATGLASAGWGTDEDYEHYGDDFGDRGDF